MRDAEATRRRVLNLLDRLGADAGSVVLVGGCAPAFYELAAFVGDQRPTIDVDLLVEGGSYAAYQETVRRLAAAAGLEPDSRPGAPVCRYRSEELVVDWMPARGDFLGFANSWYPAAWDTAHELESEDGTLVRVVSPLHFVATKLEAYRSPHRGGHGDLRASPDLEDLVRVLAGSEGLLDEVRAGRDAVHAAVREGLSELLSDGRFVDALAGFFEGDAATQAHVAPFLERLRGAVAE